jgi:hypothetical protein
MATVTLQIVNGGTTYGLSKTVSTGDLQRLLNAYMAKFGTLDATSTGVAWAQQLIEVTKQTVHAYEETVAVTSARAGVSDIGIT